MKKYVTTLFMAAIGYSCSAQSKIRFTELAQVIHAINGDSIKGKMISENCWLPSINLDGQIEATVEYKQNHYEVNYIFIKTKRRQHRLYETGGSRTPKKQYEKRE